MFLSNFHISFLLFLFVLNCNWFSKADGNKDSALTYFASPKSDQLPFFRGKDLEAFWPEDNQTKQNARTVDPFAFQNQMNQKITESHFKDKISVVSFFFARCHGICPNIVRNLKFVQSAYREDSLVQIVSYSVTPDLDTPDELKKFAEEKGIYSTKWSLLTGDREKVFAIARNTFQADTNTTNKNPDRDFVHSEQVFLVGPDLRFRGIYNGNKGDSIKTMIADIKVLEKELRENKFSTN